MRTEKRKAPSIRTRLVSTLVVLSAVLIAIILISQFFLLDGIYRVVRTHELMRSLDGILALSNAPSFLSLARERARESSLCIKIFRGDGSSVMTGECFFSCALHSLERGQLAALISGAKDDLKDSGSLLLDIAPAKDGKGYNAYRISSPFYLREGGSAAVLATIPSGDAELYVMINTVIAPTAAFKTSFTLLIALISVVIVLLASITAIILSKSVAAPLSDISREAKNLSRGSYKPVRGGYREIDELNEILKASADELSKLEALRRELIANVSHDLRTPLTMMIGYGEVMRDIPGELTRENLETVISEARQLSLLVNDLLDLSRLESDSYSPTLSEFSLTECTREIVCTMQELTRSKGYRILFKSDSDIWICADRLLISRAVKNLICNAITYTGEDKTVKVWISALDGEGLARVSVADSGEGIPKEELATVFDRYYRAREHKRSVVGTGLGLSIVRSAVSLHKGRYRVRSKSGLGSVFSFDLPMIARDDTNDK